MKQIKILVIRELRLIIRLNESIWRATNNIDLFLNQLVVKGELSVLDVALIKEFLIKIFDCDCIIREKYSLSAILEELKNKEFEILSK